MNTGVPCILHIGLEKTGTTTLQNFLAANRECLATRGILSPRSLSSRSGSNHAKLTAYAANTDRSLELHEWFGIHDPGKAMRFREFLAGALAREMAASRGRIEKIICSNEHLSSRLIHVEELERLKSLLAAYCSRITVVVYLRRQDRQKVSLYSTWLRGGHGTTISSAFECEADERTHQIQQDVKKTDALQAACGEDFHPFYHDYHGLLCRWREVFGPDALQIRIYEDCRKALIEDFCSVAGIRLTPDLRRPPSANQALSAVAQAMLLGINRSGLFSEQERKRLVGLLEREVPGRPALPSRAAAMAWQERWRDSNERLRREFLPEHPAPLFDEDFSEYPLEGTEVQPAFDDALGLIQGLLRDHERTLAAARTVPEGRSAAAAARARATLIARAWRRLRRALSH